ncbi:hypothetical protein LCGC14_1620430 [marine sediment metagenome]|uniref:HhH-GPD domain-containing protein n=1 Tax=marine sediment metagenome TaxID=412755 RepID=A0A0F9I5N6_9ZZZZ
MLSQELHSIDRPDEGNKYSNLELDEFMVFCILDTSVPYEKCCQAFDALKKSGMTTRRKLRKCTPLMVKLELKNTGYRWANQKAKYLMEFADNPINLKTATREEMVKNVKGVGMKLASMFLRNTRGHEYAVIDVHTDRWLEKELKAYDQWKPKMSYEEKEKAFINFAKILGTTPKELDLKIWQENRIGNRK